MASKPRFLNSLRVLRRLSKIDFRLFSMYRLRSFRKLLKQQQDAHTSKRAAFDEIRKSACRLLGLQGSGIATLHFLRLCLSECRKRPIHLAPKTLFDTPGFLVLKCLLHGAESIRPVLKPIDFIGFIGTTEVVPCYKARNFIGMVEVAPCYKRSDPSTAPA